jgi:hypothetical protein
VVIASAGGAAHAKADQRSSRGVVEGPGAPYGAEMAENGLAGRVLTRKVAP